MKRYASIGLAIAVLTLVLNLASCGPQSTPQASANPASANTLTIKIPLVTWGGYAALFAANNGADPTEDSLFYKYGKFKVQLVQEENPANQLQGFANGTYQIIWSTMDMLPINNESLSKDSRTVPKVIGLFDYSAGGDGIIVRGAITDAKGLKGKKIVCAQYTPSHFFLLWYLGTAGLTQKDCTVIFAADAIAAKDSFVNDKEIDACVTWSPFIYDITDSKKASYVKGSTLLTSSLKPADTKSAYVHGLIADVYLTSAEFAEKNPAIIEAFTKAMIDGYDLFEKDRTKVAGQIATFFGIKGGAEEVNAMFGDVIIAGRAENLAFFAAPGTIPVQPDATASGIFNMAVKLYQTNDPDLGKSLKGTAESTILTAPMFKAAAAQ